GVEQQQPVGHVGTTTDSAAGTTVNVAGSVPAYSPSANTWNSRSAEISMTFPSNIVTAGCVTWLPLNTFGNVLMNCGLDTSPITHTSRVPESTRAPGVIIMP